MGQTTDTLPEHYEDLLRAFLSGPSGVAGNGTEAWLYAVDPDAKRGTAASNASRVLRKEAVRKRMHALRLEAAGDVDMTGLRDWMELAPDAQDTLHRAATGQLPDTWTDEQIRSAVKAAQTILDRAIGPIAQRLDVRSQSAIVVKTLGPGEYDSEPSRNGAHSIEAHENRRLTGGVPTSGSGRAVEVVEKGGEGGSDEAIPDSQGPHP